MAEEVAKRTETRDTIDNWINTELTGAGATVERDE